jgi:hypothetical protein
LRHAWALTRGCFWRLLGFIILITLLSGIASMAAQTIFGALAGLAAGPEAARLVGGVASAGIAGPLPGSGGSGGTRAGGGGSFAGGAGAGGVIILRW